MAAPIFLDIDRVIRTHRSLIEAYEVGLVEMTLSVACGSSGRSESAEFCRSKVPALGDGERSRMQERRFFAICAESRHNLSGA